MKSKMLEPKTDTRTSPSPYQAERAEAQQTPVLRPDPLGGALVPPGSEATVRGHVAGLKAATAGQTMRRLQRQYGNRYAQRVMETAQRRGSGEGFTLDDETAGRIHRARDAGQSLDGAMQAQMSEALGYDFTGVRVHTDAEADALNQQLSARAFTTGRDIFFKRGAYDPVSGGGRALIAHELAHVVQQTTGRVWGGGNGVTVRRADDGLEHEAASAARASMTHARIAEPRPRHGSAEPGGAAGGKGGAGIGRTGLQLEASGLQVQRSCWEMSVLQVASFVEGQSQHVDADPNQVYWRMQADDHVTTSSFFAPVTEDGPDVWGIAEDGIVTTNERQLLALLHAWVPEWKWLVMYLVRLPGERRPFWGITGEQEEPGGWVYQGGALQAVFPAEREAEVIAAVPVQEVGWP